MVVANADTRAQDQRALLDQLLDLVKIATERGMYDAADWLRGHTRPPFDRRVRDYLGDEIERSRKRADVAEARFLEGQKLLLEAYWEADMDISRFAFRVLHALDPEKYQ